MDVGFDHPFLQVLDLLLEALGLVLVGHTLVPEDLTHLKLLLERCPVMVVSGLIS